MTQTPFDCFTDIDLKAELERRERIEREAARPKLVDKPNLVPLIALCDRYINDLHNGNRPGSDIDQYIYEAALQVLYGEDVFVWINSQRG